VSARAVAAAEAEAVRVNRARREIRGEAQVCPGAACGWDVQAEMRERRRGRIEGDEACRESEAAKAVLCEGMVAGAQCAGWHDELGVCVVEELQILF
jgi:hypothetical protein